MTMTLATHTPAPPHADTAQPPAYAETGRHDIMTDPNGGPDYYWNPGLTATAALAVRGHHCLPDDSGGSWYTEDRLPFNVPAASAEAKRTGTVGTYQGRDIYRVDLDAESATETAPSYVQPVTLAAHDIEQALAAAFTSSVWERIERAGGPRTDRRDATLFQGAVTPALLAELSLPMRGDIPDGQPVTLSFSTPARYTDRAELLEAYRAQPRTWVFENAHQRIPWLNLAAARLGRLSASKLDVLAAVFDSEPEDETPGAHTDEWYSVIVQVAGAKTWTIGTDAPQEQHTTRAGDLLLIPEGVVHATATPHDPGYSRHIQFTLCRHTVYTIAAIKGAQ